MLLHLCKLAATVNRYFERWSESQVPEPITYEEFRCLFPTCSPTPWTGNSACEKPSDGSASTSDRERIAFRATP